MHRTPQKTRDFFIQNDDGSTTDLKTHNTTRALEVIWKGFESKMKKYVKINRAALSPKERGAMKERLTTALENAQTLKEFTTHRKIQEPEGINHMISSYFEWIRNLNDLNQNDIQKREENLPSIQVVTEEEVRNTRNESITSIKTPPRAESPTDSHHETLNESEIELRALAIGTQTVTKDVRKSGNIDPLSEHAKRDAGIRSLLEGAIPKKKATGYDYSRGSPPRRYSGIETIATEIGDKDIEQFNTTYNQGKDTNARFNNTYNHEERTGNRGPRTSTFNIKRENEGTKLGDMTFTDLSQMIQSIMIATHAATLQNQNPTHNYTIAPRPKYHLVDLKSFTGKMEDYPAWRQNLDICLERETFKDEKDKALFVLNHLSGTPYDQCKYFVRSLTENSYKNMMSKLDRNYGSTKALDMSLILKLYKLPKLNYLSKENLDVMITVIEAALDPLKDMDPSALTNSSSEKYLRLLSLLPLNEQDNFDVFCTLKNIEPNVQSLLEFLQKKHEIRRTTEELNKHSHSGKHIMKIEETSEEYKSSDDELFAIQEKKPQPVCGACKGPHGLGVCEKFKGLTLDERRTVVDNARACSSCLRSGHFVRTCRLKRRCTAHNCNRYHHPLLHDENLNRILYFEEVGGFPEEQ